MNRRPRRWTDRSAKVRVIEGWHPSHPDQVGYNLVIDGDWIGTYASLEGAARAAGRASSPDAADPGKRTITLIPLLEPARRRRP